MASTMEHKCPSCGASLRFDIGTQSVTCQYCNAVFSPDELKDDLEAETVEIVPDTTDGSSDFNEYSCESCGAAIYTDETTAATMCPYCGNAVILKGRLSGMLKPDKVIPFKKTKQDALNALKEHCNSRKFVAKGFLDENKLEEVKGLYVPFWLFDADIHADVQYNCSESHGSGEDRVTNYYFAERIGDVAFDNLPVDGSVKMPDDLMESIEPYDYSRAEDFRTSYLTGYVAEKYDMSRDEAEARATERLEDGAAQMFQKTLHGYDSIEVYKNDCTMKNLNSKYVMYPVWLMNLSWNGETFRFAMNGQTGRTVGNLPINKVKLNGCIIGLFIAMVAVIGLGLSALSGQINPPVFFWAAIFSGIIVYALRKGFMKSLLNVEMKYGASDYYREGSMVIEHESDERVSRPVGEKPHIGISKH